MCNLCRMQVASPNCVCKLAAISVPFRHDLSCDVAKVNVRVSTYKGANALRQVEQTRLLPCERIDGETKG